MENVPGWVWALIIIAILILIFIKGDTDGRNKGS